MKDRKNAGLVKVLGNNKQEPVVFIHQEKPDLKGDYRINASCKLRFKTLKQRVEFFKEYTKQTKAKKNGMVTFETLNFYGKNEIKKWTAFMYPAEEGLEEFILECDLIME